MLAGAPGLSVEGSASDGVGALELARSLGAGVLVLDISMPGPDGLEVAGRIRDEGLPVKVILLSMHDDPAIVRKAFEIGVHGFVVKEEAFDDLLTAIRTAARGGRYFSAKALPLLAKTREEPGVPRLSPREKDVASRIGRGHTVKEIAASLGISPKTVETHRQRIMEKLGCRKSTEIAVYAARKGML